MKLNARPHMNELLTVREHLIRLANLVELVQVNLHIVRILERVMQEGELLEGDSDLLVRGASLALEHVVEVLMLGILLLLRHF